MKLRELIFHTILYGMRFLIQTVKNMIISRLKQLSLVILILGLVVLGLFMVGMISIIFIIGILFLPIIVILVGIYLYKGFKRGEDYREIR